MIRGRMMLREAPAAPESPAGLGFVAGLGGAHPHCQTCGQPLGAAVPGRLPALAGNVTTMTLAGLLTHWVSKRVLGW